MKISLHYLDVKKKTLSRLHGLSTQPARPARRALLRIPPQAMGTRDYLPHEVMALHAARTVLSRDGCWFLANMPS